MCVYSRGSYLCELAGELWIIPACEFQSTAPRLTTVFGKDRLRPSKLICTTMAASENSESLQKPGPSQAILTGPHLIAQLCNKLERPTSHNSRKGKKQCNGGWEGQASHPSC